MLRRGTGPCTNTDDRVALRARRGVSKRVGHGLLADTRHHAHGALRFSDGHRSNQPACDSHDRIHAATCVRRKSAPGLHACVCRQVAFGTAPRKFQLHQRDGLGPFLGARRRRTSGLFRLHKGRRRPTSRRAGLPDRNNKRLHRLTRWPRRALVSLGRV
jgi:hypothetical protein